MSLSLYVDHHVRSSVTKGLRRRGVDVLTALEDGRDAASDEEILARAAELGRTIFTQDDDFLILAAHWQSTGRLFAGVVYAHQLQATVGQIITDLQLLVETVLSEEIRNSVLFLPL